MKLKENIRGRNINNNQILQSPNCINNEYFLESSLKLSEIENKENEQVKKLESINSYNFESISINISKQKPKVNIKNIKKKITKEDLNNIPLPIFSCIYCSNEKISFNHLITEIIYGKYFLQTSIYDMKSLDEIIKIKTNLYINMRNSPLINLVIKSTEFIRHYYNKNELNKIFESKKIKKIYEENYNKAYCVFIRKLKYKLMIKKRKDFSNNKTCRNKFFLFNDYKTSFQKQNNNSSFTNDNLTTNKNSMTNTTGTLSPNIHSSLSLNNNNNDNGNNINICFNYNNAMESIMEKIEKNEESDGESEEKFINTILGKSNHSTKRTEKNKISFENKYYDIWNPDITVINDEENEPNTNKINLFDKNVKKFKKIIIFRNKKDKIYSANFICKKNTCDNNIINYNIKDNINKKLKENNNNIFSSYINNNIKKKNLVNFINYKNRRRFNIVSIISKQQFSAKHKNLLDILATQRSKGSFNNIFSSQRQYPKINKNLLDLLKHKKIKDKNCKNNNKILKKSISTTKRNLSQRINKKFISSGLSNYNSGTNKHISIFNKFNDLSIRKRCSMNLELDINNKKLDKIPNNIKKSKSSIMNYSLKKVMGISSLPNLYFSLSPINKIKINPNKKIRIKNNSRRINSYNFLQTRFYSLNNSHIKTGIFSVNK